MTQTPLQEAIQKLESLKSEISNSLISKDQKAWALSVNESAIQHIKLLLPKEKEFVGSVWDAAVKWEVEDGWIQIEESAPPPDKQQFIENLYKQS